MTMASPSERALSALIGSVYDCVLDPSRWEQALADIALALGCEKAILSLNDLGHDRVLIKKSFGWEPYWLGLRETHLPEIHSAVSEWLLRKASLEEPFIASRHIPASYMEVSPYVRECLSPQGIVDIAHFFLISTPTHFSELVLGWQDPHGAMTEGEVELGALLLPHLRRAVTISNVLDIGTIERTRMAETFDALRYGVMLTNGRGAVLHANRSAERMLRNGSPIGILGGTLHAKYRAANNELSKAIFLAAQDESKIGEAGIAIRLTEIGVRPVYAHVLPLARGDIRTQLQPEAVAAVFIDAAPATQAGADFTAAAFGLTEAEARVISNLLAGRTLFETAADLGIARTTARTHLSNIFQKTGVSRQAELVRLAMQAVPPSRCSDS
ncbi:conserved hypothetical protein [Mesorhizobium prunaredense]|uniref:HTH luxR-type domain-containing protein n=1 Tax=Mesorhizobium prunaredense TaxID=1631249 RepID=A0A1R3VEQ2_9HYPH|nr:LuxR C-terminal-related transcriptional regulator [Mesorhizobium prunaredense]SIT58386.1 conserved hypothetical protein [Mesorhizobium prunaredense]